MQLNNAQKSSEFSALDLLRIKTGESLPTGISSEIKQEDINRFAEASGDKNPIHLDEGAAKKMGLPGVIAHGMLTMSLMAQWLSQNLDRAARIASFDNRFASMVFLGDQISIQSEIVEIEEKKDFREMKVRLQALNQNQKLVAEGEALIEVQRSEDLL
jgi:acyl dehydratase